MAKAVGQDLAILLQLLRQVRGHEGGKVVLTKIGYAVVVFLFYFVSWENSWLFVWTRITVNGSSALHTCKFRNTALVFPVFPAMLSSGLRGEC